MEMKGADKAFCIIVGIIATAITIMVCTDLSRGALVKTEQEKTKQLRLVYKLDSLRVANGIYSEEDTVDTK